MRCITRKTVYQSRSDEFRLIPLGDVHMGNRLTEEKLLRRIVKEIEEDPLCYWLGLGDYCDYINMRDPRFDPDELPDWLFGRAQLKDIARTETARFLEIVKPIKDKCIGLIEGNHETSILRHSETDVYSILIEGLASDHEHRLDHSGFIAWRFNRQGGSTWTLTIFATHGAGGGTSKGNSGNKLGKLVEQVDGADVVLMGHLHDPTYKPIARRRMGRREAQTVTIHAVSIPALCGHMKYAQNKDYPAMPVGYTELVIKPDAKSVQVNMMIV